MAALIRWVPSHDCRKPFPEVHKSSVWIFDKILLRRRSGDEAHPLVRPDALFEHFRQRHNVDVVVGRTKKPFQIFDVQVDTVGKTGDHRDRGNFGTHVLGRPGRDRLISVDDVVF
jgi:hypothetical protein